jgi:hypothetical protein
MNKNNELSEGWLEVLYRKEDMYAPDRMADINYEDYVVVSSKLPLQEFDSLFDVLGFYLQERTDVLRPIKAFDAISLFRITPEVGSNTFLVVPNKVAKRFARTNCNVHTIEWSDYTLIPVFQNQRFPSFLHQEHE